MSEVRVNNIVDYGGKGAPTFDNGAVISGVSSLGNQAKIGSNVTITSGGINVSGVTTAATLSGNLTGDVNAGFLTATSTVIGSGVTINATGLNITGVVTATTFEGSGANMTGVAMTIAPLAYDPDPSDTGVIKNTGIGITFDHRILAGSGNITLSVATNAGAAGTVVENFGVGSSVTIQGRRAVISPSSPLTIGDTYHISYPSGAFTNTSGDVSYVGTAYTFGVADEASEAWGYGQNENGCLGVNNRTNYSSPIQIPGTTWDGFGFTNTDGSIGIKNNGTIWTWGTNIHGVLGLNQAGGPTTNAVSSPVQCTSATNWRHVSACAASAFAINTSGELYAWGRNTYGTLGINEGSNTKSSPVQVPGTTWRSIAVGGHGTHGTKTDGTLWYWGGQAEGSDGSNGVGPSGGRHSSPIQLGSDTTWSRHLSKRLNSTASIKTDGTLWIWGKNNKGQLGQNSTTYYSSPVQIPGTTWKSITGTANDTAYGGADSEYFMAVKTDGTLWSWGYGTYGVLGQGDAEHRSSPVQIPGTNWKQCANSNYNASYAVKTDGTLWNWGNGDRLATNSRTNYSSPVQVPGTSWNETCGGGQHTFSLKGVPI